jgi:hypothetical protein
MDDLPVELDAELDPALHIIKRTDGGLPLFFSLKIGMDYGSPSGGWTDDASVATQMTKYEANKRLETSLQSLAPFCKVEPL